MTFNFSDLSGSLIVSCTLDQMLGMDDPPQTPVRIHDLVVTRANVDMDLPMGDPCERCGGFNMKVGDWVCWGTCYRCFKELEDEVS